MLSYRKWMALLATSLTLWMGLAHAQARPPVADNVVAYQGQQGIKVWTLRVGERSANEALVQIEGVDHDWNMRIQKMSVEKTSKDTEEVLALLAAYRDAAHAQQQLELLQAHG